VEEARERAKNSPTVQTEEQVTASPVVEHHRPRTPAPPSVTSTEDHEGMEDDTGGEPEHIYVNTPEVDVLARQAEYLHIPADEPMAMQTQTQMGAYEAPPFLAINPIMGHVIDDVDPEAVHQAAGSDRDDPPEVHHHFCNVQEVQQHIHGYWDHFQLPQYLQRYAPPILQEPPRGGGGGGGGRGGGGRGRGGGPHPPPPGLIPPFAAPPAAPHLMDKFIGNLLLPFTGDRTKAEDFLTQWDLYCGANRNNLALQNQYQKCMLFLTYVQGKLIQPWVVVVA
jgi:hypothetical protein